MSKLVDRMRMFFLSGSIPTILVFSGLSAAGLAGAGSSIYGSLRKNPAFVLLFILSAVVSAFSIYGLIRNIQIRREKAKFIN